MRPEQVRRLAVRDAVQPVRRALLREIPRFLIAGLLLTATLIWLVYTD